MVTTNYEDKDDGEDGFVDTIAQISRLWTDVTTRIHFDVVRMGNKYTAPGVGAVSF
jgi:hypothetical protein